MKPCRIHDIKHVQGLFVITILIVLYHHIQQYQDKLVRFAHIWKGWLFYVQPVKIPIEDILDLHTFRPKDLPDLLVDYFEACIDEGIYSVRIVHGKGRGLLKKRVQELLKKNSMVKAFQDAPPEAGGWGATLVELKSK